jgi:hypothetical protein
LTVYLFFLGYLVRLRRLYQLTVYLFFVGYLVRLRRLYQSTYLFVGYLVRLRRLYQLTVYLFFVGVSCWAQAIISIDSLLIYFGCILLGSGDYINWQSTYFFRGILLGSGDYINWRSTYFFGVILLTRRLYQLTVYLFFVGYLGNRRLGLHWTKPGRVDIWSEM